MSGHFIGVMYVASIRRRPKYFFTFLICKLSYVVLTLPPSNIKVSESVKNFHGIFADYRSSSDIRRSTGRKQEEGRLR